MENYLMFLHPQIYLLLEDLMRELPDSTLINYLMLWSICTQTEFVIEI